jgi:hypothetical protein
VSDANQNDSSIDMDLYVRAGQQRPIRLGFAPGDTIQWSIPPQ